MRVKSPQKTLKNYKAIKKNYRFKFSRFQSSWTWMPPDSLPGGWDGVGVATGVCRQRGPRHPQRCLVTPRGRSPPVPPPARYPNPSRCQLPTSTNNASRCHVLLTFLPFACISHWFINFIVLGNENSAFIFIFSSNYGKLIAIIWIFYISR